MTEKTLAGKRIAVLLPCYNEEASIAAVVSEFKRCLPQADVYVYDNNSTDRTNEIARAAGAIVRKEKRQGKGNVIRRMFQDVDADIYIMADGDGTYHAPSAPAMAALLEQDHLDMVVGIRKATDQRRAYRSGHAWGNRFFCRIIQLLFIGSHFTDVLSGYRVMSRRFVKTFSNDSKGFEVEVQLTVHALELSLPCEEFQTPYAERPEGSQSKLRTYRDGWAILMEIARLLKEARPLFFFGIASLLPAAAALAAGIPVIAEYMETGLVPRFPTAILASGLGVLSAVMLSIGLMLDSVSKARIESKRLAYLALKR